MRMIILACLLFAATWPALAQGGELKFATWNLEWLTSRPAGDPALPPEVVPKSAADIALLRGYAEQLAADVVAIQEVDGPEIAAALFPPARYRLHLTRDSVVQRVGIAVRQDLAFTANPDLVALDVAPPGRRHLRSGADITLDPQGAKLRVLAVHLKTGCRQEPLASTKREECGMLRLQLAALQGWVAARQREGAPFVVLGDFNRWMDSGDAFWAELRRAAPLIRPTEGAYSPCWGGGGFIDHLLIGGPARDWVVARSLKVLVYRETGAGWKERLSDHCPVSARLRLP